MISRRKQKAFEKHKDIIYILYYAGKGIMFRSHLLSYFEMFGYQRKSVEAMIRELIDAELVEVIRFGNAHILKLKKFAVYTLLDKKPFEVSSISITSTKIMRSAFTLELLIRRFKKLAPVFFEQGIKKSVTSANMTTSYTAFERQGYEFLYTLDQHKILTNSGLQELEDLQVIHEYSITKNPPDDLEEEMQEIRRRRFKFINTVSLNSFPARNIHFKLYRISGRYFLQLELLDLNSNLSEKKVTERLNLSYRYMRQVLIESVVIRANIVVASELRESYFNEKSKNIKRDFQQSNGVHDFKLEVVNLNIENSLFNGMTIIH